MIQPRFGLRPFDVRVLVGCGLVLALATGDVVSGGPLTHADHQIRAAVQPRQAAAPAWMNVVGALGNLGVAAAVMAIAGLVAAQARWRFWPLVLSAGNFVAVEALLYVVKVAVGRPGPVMWADGTDYPGYFPSGHTATATVSTATAIFLMLALRWGEASLDRASTVALVGGFIVALIAAVRAVVGDFHWASDGLGGLALGVIVLTVGFGMTRAHVCDAAATRVRGGERQ